MTVTVHYLAQLRLAAGCSSETVTLEPGATVGDLVRFLTLNHGSAFGDLLIDKKGRHQPTVLVFADDEQVEASADLGEGMSVTLLTPIAGG